MQIDITGFTGSLCARARRMIVDGADPATTVEWVRGGTAVFAQTATLADWAKWTVSERDNQSVRMVRYRPMPDALKSHHRSAPHGGCDAEATQTAAEASAAVRAHGSDENGNADFGGEER